MDVVDICGDYNEKLPRMQRCRASCALSTSCRLRSKASGHRGRKNTRKKGCQEQHRLLNCCRMARLLLLVQFICSWKLLPLSPPDTGWSPVLEWFVRQAYFFVRSTCVMGVVACESGSAVAVDQPTVATILPPNARLLAIVMAASMCPSLALSVGEGERQCFRVVAIAQRLRRQRLVRSKLPAQVVRLLLLSLRHEVDDLELIHPIIAGKRLCQQLPPCSCEDSRIVMLRQRREEGFDRGATHLRSPPPPVGGIGQLNLHAHIGWTNQTPESQ